MPAKSDSKQADTPLFRESMYPVLLAALVLFHFGVNIWWLSADNHTIRTDEETHMEMARRYYVVLFSGEYDTLIEKFIALSNIEPGNPMHPPFAHILGAITVRLFGYSTDYLTLMNTFFFMLMIPGCFLLFRRFLDPWPALFGTFVVSFTPAVYMPSRYFMTDFTVMALTVWIIYALLRTERFSKTPWVFLFAVLNGCAILTRTAAFLYYLAPAAMLFLLGLAGRLPAGEKKEPGRPLIWRVLFNGVLTVVVSTGIFMPWYFNNGEDFYNFWVRDHQHLSGGPVALYTPPAKEKSGPSEKTEKKENAGQENSAPGETPSAAGQAAAEKQAIAPAFVRRIAGKLLHPKVPWKRYPFFVVNNGVFLPAFLTGCAGMLLALLLSRFRNLTTLTLAAWLLGSWALMTIVFKFANPRYAIPAIPPLAMFAVLPILSIPVKRARFTVMGITAFILIFQFGNLTVHAYGPLARLEIPVRIDPVYHERFEDPGLVIYKDRLAMSDAYAQLSAPVDDNYKDRIFKLMLRAEKERRAWAKGEYANYVRLCMRGMDFDQVHYWPKPNAFQRPGIQPDLIPTRKLRCIDYARTPDQLFRKLPNAEYIVYSVPNADEALEQQWISFFARHDFEFYDHFNWDRFGAVEKQIIGLLVRKPDGEVITIDSREDIDKLNLISLYNLRRSASFTAMKESLRAYVRERIENEISGLKPAPFAVNDHITYITATLSRLKGNWYQFQFIFRTEKKMDQNWRMYFHGKVEAQYLNQIPERFRPDATVMWNFDPDPPTSAWDAGEYMLITHRIQAAAIPYEMKIGFFENEDGFYGSAVQLGKIDLSRVQ